ncbi:MAG: VanW family protein [Lachnospiraceae bacterium]|nr:VanW family protein [Lachnospiraceae bacterium]
MRFSRSGVFYIAFLFCMISFMEPVYARKVDIKVGGAGIGLENEELHNSSSMGSESDPSKTNGQSSTASSSNPQSSSDIEADTSVDLSVDIGAEIKKDNAKESDYENSLGTNYDTIDPATESTSKTLNINMSGTINNNIYAGNINLSNMSYTQAESAIRDYVTSLGSNEVTFEGIDQASKTVSARDLGISWSNTSILESAIELGKSGNPISRYKKNKDISYEKKVYDIKCAFDETRVRSIIEELAAECDVDPVSPVVKRESGHFVIKEEGVTGKVIDVDASVRAVSNELSDWSGGPMTISMKVIEEKPKGTIEDFANMTDVLGSYTTSFSSSGSDRSGNVRNGTNLVNGTLLYPGEQFSMYKTVSPFTEENGYFLAGSYSNGIVVESLGGGICQVSSTLYNAVLRAELQIDERHNHSMIVNYVKLSSDAAISGTAKDFKFTNTKDTPIYIEGYTTSEKEVVFNIYGMEDRPSNRTLEFESLELSKTEPEGENIIADPAAPVGSISTQSAHTGYVGELWKIVKIDGNESERVKINKSTYRMVPKTATVGVAADDAAISEAVRAAIATGSIDAVKSTIAQLTAAAEAAAAQAALALPAEGGE